jgi:hypothetical protein
MHVVGAPDPVFVLTLPASPLLNIDPSLANIDVLPSSPLPEAPLLLPASKADAVEDEPPQPYVASRTHRDPPAVFRARNDG